MTAVLFDDDSRTGRLRSRPWRTAAVLTGALVVVLTGCGLSDHGDQASGTKKDAPVSATGAKGGSSGEEEEEHFSGPAQQKALASVLLKTDLEGYLAGGEIEDEPAEVPGIECLDEAASADHTTGNGTGQTLTSIDGKVEIDSTARSLDTADTATKMAGALDDQSVADCFGSVYAKAYGGQGSFTVTAPEAEPTGGDQVETLRGTFAESSYRGTTSDVQVNVVAVRTGDVVTLITERNTAGALDPNKDINTAIAAIAAHQSA